MEIRDAGVEKNRIGGVEVNPHILRVEDAYRGLRVCPLGGGDGAAAIMVTATGAADDKPGIRPGQLVAMVSSADAACVPEWGRNREHRRRKTSRKSQKQQQSGGQAMHASL